MHKNDVQKQATVSLEGDKDCSGKEYPVAKA